ncbi:hypothetical protein FHR92_000028 [Fontibacillus solani]|uniref:Uncharacterized protein n=2 Tax=Fontibacillus TaxID=995014 RepID=A0A1G7T502_9BACL|nr:hypothetical protein [Fontibacillus solani]SDG30094.1 hypothetical protein SAMN04488542_13420 [Fontibacillus panacisegetis]
MVTYGCLTLLFLFVIVKSILYYTRRTHIVAPQELDKRLLKLINDEERAL